jgi:hypothetical protein
MKRLILLSMIIIQSFLFINCGNPPKTKFTEKQKEGLESDSKEFMASLKSVLIKEIQMNGIVAALSVCSDTAQILTNKFGLSKGIYIKRVSLRNRNSNNSPDEFEYKALKYFEDLKAQNKLNDNTEYFEIVKNNDVESVRFMKPIIVQALCINCHGSRDQISPEIQTILQKKYPLDKATDYQIGDLRGAVSIQKTL